jgi:hypothetical protein
MKKRPMQFKFRLCDEERAAIVALAERLHRSQSDAVRFVVLEAARQLTQQDHIPTADASKAQQVGVANYATT